MSAKALTEWRQNWKVVAGSLVAMGVGFSAWQYAMSSLVQPLQQAFGWSRTEIAFALNASLLSALVAPFLGRLVDRFGARRCLITAFPLLGLCYIALANMNGSLIVYYVLYAALSIIGMFTTGVTYGRAITGWFDASRGLALSISRLGLALVGSGLPLLMLEAVNRFGWQGGYYAMAALALFVGWPMVWLTVYDKPNDPRRALVDAKIEKATGIKLWLTLLGNRRVIIMCLAIALGYAPMYGILSQLHPLLVWHKLEPKTAAEIMAFFAGSTVLATLVAGFLLDRIWAPLVGFLFTLSPVVGCFLLMGDNLSVQTASIAVALIGIAVGAEIDIIAYLTSRYFGITRFGAIYGLITLFIGTFNAFGGMAFGRAYDVFGGYREALGAAAICYLISATAYLFLGRYPKAARAQETVAASIAAPSAAE